MKKLLKGRTMPAYIRDKPSILVHRGINPLKKSGRPVTRISTIDKIRTKTFKRELSRI
jgi:hypothetical protein